MRGYEREARLRSTYIVTGLVAAWLFAAVEAGLLITEVMTGSGMQEFGHDWVEVTNFNSRAVNVTGWSVQVGGTHFRIVEPLQVAAYESASLIGDYDESHWVDSWRGVWGLPKHALVVGIRQDVPHTPVFSMMPGGDTVTLCDSWGTEVDSVSWSLPPSPGASLQWNHAGVLLGSSDVGMRGARASAAAGAAQGVASPCGYAAAAVDVNAGAASSDPSELHVLGRHLYFAADGGDGRGRELWVHAGGDNVAAARRVSDIWLGGGDSSPTSLTSYQGALYFAADDGQRGRELWKYRPNDDAFEGPAAPTLVEDIHPGASGGDPAELVVLQGALYFAATSAAGRRELWRLDGSHPRGVGVSHGGPVQVEDADLLVPVNLGGYTNPKHLLVHAATIAEGSAAETRLYFAASDAGGTGVPGGLGEEAWVLGAGRGAPVLLGDLCVGPCSSSPSFFTSYRGALYFSADGGSGERDLWMYAGSGNQSDSSQVAAGTGDAPLVSSPTAGGVLSSAAAGAGVTELVVFRDKLFFVADDGVHGMELFVYVPGTAPTLAADVEGGAGSSSPHSLTLYHPHAASHEGAANPHADSGIYSTSGYLLFVATTVAGGRELYLFDGRHAPQVLSSAQPRPGPLHSVPSSLPSPTFTTHVVVEFQERVYFTADNGVTGAELHVASVAPSPHLETLCGAPHHNAGAALQHAASWGPHIRLSPISSSACALKLLDPLGAPGDAAGSAVAVDKDDAATHSIAVGSPTGGGGAGHVTMWSRVPITTYRLRSHPSRPWEVSARLTGSSSTAGDRFGAAIALSRDILAVAAPGKGCVYIFMRRNGIMWVEHTSLVPWDVPTNGVSVKFGESLALHKDVLVVGAPDAGAVNGGAAGAGAVYVWRHDGEGAWKAEAKLQQEAPFTGDACGTSVAVYGDILVAGAPGDSANRGAVFTWMWEALTWRAPAFTKLHPADLVPGARYGASLDIDGSLLAVGAPGDTGGRGAVWSHVFDDELRELVVSEKSLARDAEAGDALGYAVAVARDPRHTLATGPLSGVAVADAGVYVFQRGRNDATWPQAGKLLPWDASKGDQFGMALALSHSTGVLGAPGDDEGGVAAGSVYVTACPLQSPTRSLHYYKAPSRRSAPPPPAHTCKNGEFADRRCLAGVGGSCSSCSSGPCPAGSFEVAPCSWTSDRECASCSSSTCPLGMELLHPCTPQADRQCVNVSTTSNVSVVAASATPSAPTTYAHRACVGTGLCPTPSPVPWRHSHKLQPLHHLQRRQLQGLWEAAGGAHWGRGYTWPNTSSSSDPCVNRWEGVTCDYNGNVERLVLRGASLNGHLPTDFGQHLPVLSHLDLSSNHLSGPLPVAFSSLLRLHLLDLSNNFFDGGVPEEWVSLHALHSLDLSSNIHIQDQEGGPLEVLRGRGVHVAT